MVVGRIAGFRRRGRRKERGIVRRRVVDQRQRLCSADRAGSGEPEDGYSAEPQDGWGEPTVTADVRQSKVQAVHVVGGVSFQKATRGVYQM